MLASKFFIRTQREAPSEADITSHKLMLRAGLIKKLGSGLYTWMPLGLRVLNKVINIVQEEMNKSGAIELLMPAIQPAELWKKSGRWDKFGPQMLKVKDRHNRDFCFGPTHEEVITEIANQEIHSYKQLPVHFYQIQTKFRDEIRPRFGVMRAREFIMKDGYSFHSSEKDLEREYESMHQTYSKIFTKLGLEFTSVQANTGAIGGAVSHEFHVLADSGEDTVVFSAETGYAANIELAECYIQQTEKKVPRMPMEKISTPGVTSVRGVVKFLNVRPQKIVKSILVISEAKAYLALIRGDHTLNEAKLTKSLNNKGYRLANTSEIQKYLGTQAGYVGPVNLPSDVFLIADNAVVNMSDFICGANEAGFHFKNVNFSRDLPEPTRVADLRNVVEGDRDPQNKGQLQFRRGIEVGHIFQLKKDYSKSLDASFLDKEGNKTKFDMGCYGIGISRIVAAAIEQSHDDRGIVWPIPMAPFQVAIATIGFKRNEQVRNVALKLYRELEESGVDVLLDDRDERPGVMFSDLDLLGIPYRITVGTKTLQDGKVDIESRSDRIPLVPIEEEMKMKVSTICNQILQLKSDG